MRAKRTSSALPPTSGEQGLSPAERSLRARLAAHAMHARAARQRRRQDLAAAEQLRAVDRARQRRRRGLGGPGPSGGDAA